MKDKTRPNYFLLLVVGVLIAFGVLILASASVPLSLKNFGNTYQYLKHQLLFGLLVGVLLGFVFYKIPLSFLRKRAVVLLFLNIVCLALVFLPHLGVSIKGAKRWLNTGFFLFQPSEFLKVTFLLYLAAWLAPRVSHPVKANGRSRVKISNAKTQTKKRLRQTLLAFFVILGVLTLLLILQPDMSTLLVIVVSGVLMYFAAQTPVSHLALLILTGLVACIGLIKIAPYRMTRIISFLKPATAPLSIGYQIHQALIAIGSGRIFGVSAGLGWGRQKFGFLPHPITDSIFAIIGEETGFVGSSLLVVLILLFSWLGFKIAGNSKDYFSRLLGIGITCWITVQAFFNIGSMLRLFPIGGIPLPFISYGSSHLIAELIGVGILLNISKGTPRTTESP